MHIIQQTILGLIQGSTFVLLALGFTLVWGTLRLINFAQIALYIVGGFVFLGAYRLVEGMPGALAYVVAAVIAFIVVGALGGIIAAGTWYPIRTAPNMALLVASLAVFILIQNLVAVVITAQPVQVPNPFDGTVFRLVGLPISGSALLVFGVGCLATAGLWLLVNRTRNGRAVRAVADSPSNARLLGIPYVPLVAGTFALAAGLSGLSGAMVNAHYGSVIFNGGLSIGLSGFTAAVLGGMGSIWGALLGSLLLGIISSFSMTILPANWQNAVIFAVLIIVLTIRPTGILSTKSADRA